MTTRDSTGDEDNKEQGYRQGDHKLIKKKMRKGSPYERRLSTIEKKGDGHPEKLTITPNEIDEIIVRWAETKRLSKELSEKEEKYKKIIKKIMTLMDTDIIKGKDFREIMGPNVLMSNNYEISMRGYYVDIIGKGWGHGVGMCQWGALGMAKQQFNYKQILSYYYPGSKIVKAY